MRRLRPYAFVVLLFALILGVAAYYAASWNGFYPKSIRVQGERVVPASQIVAQAGIAMHANIWLQNARAAEKRVESIPYIATARVRRSLPANVVIAVTERVPAVVIETPEQRVLADDDLRVLEDAPPQTTLPVIASDASLPRPGGFVATPDIQRLHNDERTLAAAHVIVRRVELDKFGDLTAVMPGGAKLLLGDDQDLNQKSVLIAPILSQVASQGRRIAALDLRAPKTPVVRFR